MFGDPLATTIVDEQHSTVNEERWITMGRSYGGRTLVVVHYDQEDRIRIISARVARRHERRTYEAGESE